MGCVLGVDIYLNKYVINIIKNLNKYFGFHKSLSFTHTIKNYQQQKLQQAHKISRL